MDNQQSMQMQNILREKVIYRYINALERSDADTIEAILQEAEKDEILECMITDVHRSYRSEEDVAAYAKDVAFVRQLLQQNMQEGYISKSTYPALQEKTGNENVKVPHTLSVQEDVFPPNPRVAKSTFFRRLKEIGLEKDFVLQRLLPKPMATNLQRRESTEQTSMYIQQSSAIIEQIFNWEPGILFRSTPLPLNMATVGTTRFKRNIHSDIERISAYTIYAHRLALLVLQATVNLPGKPIPTDPHLVRREVLATYGTFTFESVLQYVWSLGIPVLPLYDKGIFHGACWRVDHRNVIVLKQRTMLDARWLFDLLHEFRHAGQDSDRDEFEVIEASDMAQKPQQAEEERTASSFAGDVILNGRAEELVEMCVNAAHGSIERLKKVVPMVAQQERVSVGALANYMAYRLSLQNQNWWPTAMELQRSSADAWRIARDVLLKQANIEALDEVDRRLLLQALFDPEA